MEYIRRKEGKAHDQEEGIKISDGIFMYKHRLMSDRGNVFEGVIRSPVYDTRPCVIKLSNFWEHSDEADVLTTLGSSENVVNLIQSGTYNDGFEERLYLCLDKCQKENLRQYLYNKREAAIDFDINQATNFAKQIIRGVTYIHGKNIIHMDLKPSNILISQNQESIKICDFGLSIRVHSTKCKVFRKAQFGTNGYRPIESFGNSDVSQRSDIFSLGTVLFHLLSNGQEVYGEDDHLFVNNVMKDITYTSGLLVANPMTTEQLILCMIRKERCRRPNIWEVSQHPCWNGTESHSLSDYYDDDEVYESPELSSDSSALERSGDYAAEEAQSQNADNTAFLHTMKAMGFERKPCIAIFDWDSKRLHRYNYHDNRLTTMHEFTGDMKKWFTAVSLREHIYIFIQDRSAYKLEYCDVKATWQPIGEWKLQSGDHGVLPIVVTTFDSVYFVGGSVETVSKSMTKFDTKTELFHSLADKATATCDCGAVCTDSYLYCFGGDNVDNEATDIVEKMDLSTLKWTRLSSSMRHKRKLACCVEFKEKIFVLGGWRSDRLNTCEMYDILNGQWTDIQPMNESRVDFRSYVLDGYILAVAGEEGENSVEKYDVQQDEWKTLSRIDNMMIWDSVLVWMSS